MLKHNKKRNIGLLSEFFAKYIATAAVEFRYDDIDKARELWRKHVINNQLLRQEFSLFEMLHKTHIKDNAVAHNFLLKVKESSEKLDQKKLDEAKTRLLHEINSTLKDDNFFSRPVDDFRTIATIQVLLNTWRNKNESPNFSYVSRLEDQVLEHVTRQKQSLPPLDPSLLNHTKEDIDKLVVNVFKEKIDKKYSELLNEDQKVLVGWYVFAKNQSEAREQLVSKLSSIKESALQNIEKELKAGPSKPNREKLIEAKNCLLDSKYNVSNPNDDTMTFYLAVCALNKELESVK